MSPSLKPSADMSAAARDVLPILLAVVPFGMVFGTVAAGDGLTLLEAVGFSAAVFAGASQLAALQLIGIGAPIWSVLLAVFALNFRHVLYSASLGRHLGRFSTLSKGLAFFVMADPTFAAGEAQAAKKPLTKTYYFTYGFALYVCWLIATAVGSLLGSFIEDPAAFGIDFVLPVYFLSLTVTFRSRKTFWPVAAASAAASIVLYGVIGPPWHITLGALFGVLVAALMPVPPKTDRAGDSTQEATR